MPTAATDTPKYGGTLTLVASDPTNWDPIRATPSFMGGIWQKLWSGDWARGPAGGYGTNQTNWGAGNNDLFDLKTGFIAETTKWTIDTAKGQGTIVYQIRRGIHWAVNPASEASRLVNGREVTADDVVYCLKRATTETFSYVWNSNPELRNADIAKTAPWEVTVKVPLAALYTGISRFGEGVLFYPPEVVTKYGSMADWRVAVGSGPLMLAEYVPGSSITQIRNSNYWMTDPAGPGKGNQLPYLDSVRMLIIPDVSTRQAALRTGQLDHMAGLSQEDAAQMKQRTAALVEVKAASTGRVSALAMRTDKAPFSDVRVRRAMMMAIDLEAINQALYSSAQPIPVYPFSKTSPYEAISLSLDDPAFPESAKELYSYNPAKARQLLKDASYPAGFKTEMLLSSSEVDYYSIIKDYFAKVSIDMKLDIRDSGAVSAIKNSRTHTAMATLTAAPIGIFTTGQEFQGTNQYNLSMINDPYINDMLVKVRLAALTDQHKAMAIYKEMTIYLVDQAYVIPQVQAPSYTFWWPWVRNYSGESAVGYDGFAWYQWLWYDEALKKSMGY